MNFLPRLFTRVHFETIEILHYVIKITEKLSGE